MAGISLTKCLSYGAADTAGQLVFCVISFYLLYFYTDVYGISLGAAGTGQAQRDGCSNRFY